MLGAAFESEDNILDRLLVNDHVWRGGSTDGFVKDGLDLVVSSASEFN